MKQPKFTDISNIFEPCETSHKAGPIAKYEHGKLYQHDSDDSILVTGSSSKGKTSCTCIPFVQRCISTGETIVVVDHGGDILRATGKAASKTHDVKIIDFSDLTHSKDTWNPFNELYELNKSNDPDKITRAVEMIHSIAENLYPLSARDPFWDMAARDTFEGVCNFLLNFASPEELNFRSIISTVSYLNCRPERQLRNVSEFMTVYMKDDKYCHIKTKLNTIASGPHDTAASMLATTMAGLNKIAINNSLMDFMSTDTVKIDWLTDRKATAIYIVIPRYTNCYNYLVSLLVDSIINHYIRLAGTRDNRRLKKRVNVILDDLYAYGDYFTNLPNYLQEKKINMRYMLLLHSEAELEDLLDKNKARQILETIPNRYYYASNDYKYMSDLSERLGKKFVEGDNEVGSSYEPLIAPWQLSSMPAGTCLVSFGGTINYITHFFQFEEMSGNKVDEFKSVFERKNHEYKVFDILAFIKKNFPHERKGYYDELGI